MALLPILALAVGLAMDATAVAGARGLAAERVSPFDALRIALWFGGFQALMPLVGWFLGQRLGSAVAAWDHWIAFVLLGGIGAKMLYEAVTHDDASPDATTPARDPFGWRALSVLAVATSIDALAAGVTLPMLHLPPALSVATIGVVTAALSATGLYAGRRFGAVLGRRLDAFGGVVLIGLAVKTLVEHLSGRA